MVVFGPWVFGTTQPWAIWAMNIAGYVLGLLLLVKLFIRWLKGYQPGRWDYRTTGPQDHRTTELRTRAAQIFAAKERKEHKERKLYSSTCVLHAFAGNHAVVAVLDCVLAMILPVSVVHFPISGD